LLHLCSAQVQSDIKTEQPDATGSADQPRPTDAERAGEDAGQKPPADTAVVSHEDTPAAQAETQKDEQPQPLQPVISTAAPAEVRN